MYTLILNNSNAVRRDVDEAVIPFDASNVDYQTYKAWIAAGNTPTPAAPAAIIPNWLGFAMACKAAAGTALQLNALMVQYPAFFPAIQEMDGATVQALILDAQSKSVISATQYSAFKSAVAANNIPGVVLP